MNLSDKDDNLEELAYMWFGLWKSELYLIGTMDQMKAQLKDVRKLMAKTEKEYTRTLNEE